MLYSSMQGATNQPEIKSHISYCITAKGHLVHMGTHEITSFLPYSHTFFCSATFTVMLRSESPSGMRAKLHTVAASNNRIHTPRSLYHCLFVQHIYWCGASRTSHLWWITHSTQRQPRGCNSKYYTPTWKW